VAGHTPHIGGDEDVSAQRAIVLRHTHLFQNIKRRFPQVFFGHSDGVFVPQFKCIQFRVLLFASFE
jgi:hypothetical protein